MVEFFTSYHTLFVFVSNIIVNGNIMSFYGEIFDLTNID